MIGHVSDCNLILRQMMRLYVIKKVNDIDSGVELAGDLQ